MTAKFDITKAQIGPAAYMKQKYAPPLPKGVVPRQNKGPKDEWKFDPEKVNSILSSHMDDESLDYEEDDYKPPAAEVQKTAESPVKGLDKPDNRAIILDRLAKLKNEFKPAAEKEEKSILDDPSANPILIWSFVESKWGEDWLDWEPETLLQTAEKDNLNIHRANQDKLMAIKVLKKTPEFFDSPRVFEKVCVAFSGRVVDWGMMQEVRLHDVASCVALVNRFVADHDFSDDIAAYVAASAMRDGFMVLPQQLSFAVAEFNKAIAYHGDEELIKSQKELVSKILSSKSDLSETEGIQLLRLVRVNQHVSERMAEVDNV